MPSASERSTDQAKKLFREVGLDPARESDVVSKLAAALDVAFNEGVKYAQMWRKLSQALNTTRGAH